MLCDTLENTVRNYIKEQNMLLLGEHIVVGVSGGADSICLLELLYRFSQKEHWRITAVHIHHGIRGESADEDERFVKEFCEHRGLVCISRHYDVPNEAKKFGESEEEAGRRIRYEAFEEIRKELLADKIALAHHEDDQAETMLFHLIRGSSLKGLGGMLPVNGRRIRPLLTVKKKEICQYLKEQNISWRTDESNACIEYSRNYLRHKVLPLLEDINEAAIANISRASARLFEAEEYLSEKTLEAAERIGLYRERKHGFIYLLEADYQKEAPLIQKRLLYLALCELCGSKKDLGEKHVEELWELFLKPAGKRISLPYGLTAYRETDGIRIGIKEVCLKLKEQKKAEMLLFTEAERQKQKKFLEHHTELLPLSGRKNLTEYGIILEWKLFLMEKNLRIPKNNYTKWLDYAKISCAALFRTRRSGDWFVSDSRGGHKKLKRYFIDEKIPKEQRDGYLLLVDKSHVIWMEGGRISEEYKVRDHTRVVLELHFISEEKRQEAD